MTTHKLALRVLKDLHIKGFGSFHAGGLIAYRPALAAAFLAAVEGGLGELELVDAADLAKRESAPWPGDESGIVCGAVLAVGSAEADFASRRVRYNAEFLSKLSPLEREEFRTATGLLPHRFRDVRSWPAGLPPLAQPWIERMGRFVESRIEVDRKRARAAAEFAGEQEAKLFATFAARAERAQAEAETAVQRAAAAAETARRFTAAKIKPMGDLSSKDKAALAQEERRLAVRAKVDAVLAQVDRVREHGVGLVPTAKIERARELANQAAASFGKGDLDGALVAAQSVSAALAGPSLSGSGLSL